MAMKFRQHQRQAQAISRRMVLLFIGLIIVMVIATNLAMSLVWWLCTSGRFDYPAGFFVINTGTVLLYVLGSWLVEVIELRDGGANLALQVGGREVLEPKNIYEKRLCNVVMEVSVATGLRPPRIFILEKEDSINAFAAGWDVQDCVITVTRGSMERLTRDELQGVVAHEFSHILHGDMRLNMRLMGMVLGLQMVYNFGQSILFIDGSNGRYPRFMPFLFVGFGLALIVLGWMGWFAGQILSASVSRQREYLADASAVKYTRLVDGIAGALRKIAYQKQSENHAQLQNYKAKSLAPLFFHFDSVSRLFYTHPTISQRLKHLGVSYKRVEQLEDKKQRVMEDQFDMTHLSPAGVAGLDTISKQWQDVEFVRNTLDQLLYKRDVSDFQWSENDADEILQQAHDYATAYQEGANKSDYLVVKLPSDQEMKGFLAQQQLMSASLTWEQLAGAILSYWVIEGTPAQEKILQDLCQEVCGQQSYMMLDHVRYLYPSMREPVFDQLLTLAQSALNAEQRESLIAALRVLLQSYDHFYAQGWIRLELTQYWLRIKKTRPTIIYNRFEQVQAPIAVLTGFLAHTLFISSPQQWSQKVFNRLKLPQPAWVKPTQPLLHDALASLRRLAMMYPPTLMNVWLHEWEVDVLGRYDHASLQQNADTLWLMCALLDIPRPARLSLWFKTPQRF